MDLDSPFYVLILASGQLINEHSMLLPAFTLAFTYLDFEGPPTLFSPIHPIKSLLLCLNRSSTYMLHQLWVE